jgi:hypothetical protein
LKRTIATILLLFILVVSSVGCIPVQNDRQLANIAAQIQTLTSAITATQQELASTKQALSETQEKNKLLEQQARLATNSNGMATGLITNPVTATTAPTIVSFTVTPTNITVGQAANLQWNVAGATLVSISPGLGSVSYTGVRSIYPSTTTTYILTATNSYGSVTAYATVTVTQPYSSPSNPYYSGYRYYSPHYPSSPVFPPPRRPLFPY